MYRWALVHKQPSSGRAAETREVVQLISHWASLIKMIFGGIVRIKEAPKVCIQPRWIYMFCYKSEMIIVCILRGHIHKSHIYFLSCRVCIIISFPLDRNLYVCCVHLPFRINKCVLCALLSMIYLHVFLDHVIISSSLDLPVGWPFVSSHFLSSRMCSFNPKPSHQDDIRSLVSTHLMLASKKYVNT
jgi:hypothetical protein